MEPFEYIANPARVIFGRGSIKKLPDEVKRLSKSKPLLLSTPQQADQIKDLETILIDASLKPAGTFSNATMHTPTHVTDEALSYAKQCGADCLVSFGGGSTCGLGKAIAVRTGLPHVTVPTTYAGEYIPSLLSALASL